MLYKWRTIHHQTIKVARYNQRFAQTQSKAIYSPYTANLAGAMLYTFYIFNRRGRCLFYHHWNRPRYTLSDLPGEDQKLMFGALLALKDLAKSLSTEP